jgi:transposase-like protein
MSKKRVKSPEVGIENLPEETPDFDWAVFEKQAMGQLLSGKPLSGRDGVLTPIIQRLLQATLEGEMQAHVQENRPNRRNGSYQRSLTTERGPLQLQMPRDREGSFESLLIPKHVRTLGASLDQKVLSLFGLGMSFQDIQEHLAEMYGITVSDGTLTAITNQVMEAMRAWQNRPLASVYPFVWLDAMHFKVRHEGRVQSRAIYSVLAVGMDGIKELLGLYESQAEGARFWLGVLDQLKSRGVQDLLMVSIDGLKGFKEAIDSVFPQAAVQPCLVHQMRASMRFVAEKDRKTVARELKQVYKMSSRAQAEQVFAEFTERWGAKYPMVIRSWQANWDLLMGLYDYPELIRRMVYTTNPVESVHRQLRKVTKTKGAFVSEQALMKLLYTNYLRISEKWAKTTLGWGKIYQQLYILFPERLASAESDSLES